MPRRIDAKLEKNQNVINIVSVFLIPALLMLITESVARGSVKKTLLWMAGNPLYGFLSYAIIFLLFIIVLAFTKRPFVSMCILAVPLTAVAAVSVAKQAIRDLPVLPWNIALLKELFKDLDLLGPVLWYALAGIAAFALVMFLFIKVLGAIRVDASPMARIVGGVLSVVLLTVCFNGVRSVSAKDKGISELYNECGLVCGVTTQFGIPAMEKPEGYSEEAVRKIYEMSAAKTEETTTEELPDIIMIMGEAFWDPTWMSDVEFSQDPLAPLHELQKESIYGELVVEAYGGNTTNSEYSALTSICTSLMKPELTCYTDMDGLNTPLSVAEHLKSLGYTAEAVHPGKKTYLSRDRVFEEYGFENFYSYDDFESPKLVGDYISDGDAADKLIEMYEAHLENDPDSPYFGFMTTIESHYAFDLNDYKEANGGQYPVEVTVPESMSPENEKMLTGYTQFAYDAGQMIEKLTGYFRAQDREVVFIIFGDHLPAIGTHFSAYYEGGLIGTDDIYSDEFKDEVLKLHTTPFLIWNNKSSESEYLGKISSCYLVPVALSENGVPLDRYREFLAQSYKLAPHFGISACRTPMEGSEEVKEELAILQYDILYGRS